jgi:glucokinase
MNDLEAATAGIDELEGSEFLELNPGISMHGNRAVLFAGTGLGEALAHWSAGGHIASPSEGGHSDFAPRNGVELELCEFLAKKFGHVSWERVLSGNGIYNLYQFLQNKDYQEEPTWLSHALKGEGPSVAIMRAAGSGENCNCRKARDLFIQFFGREAGNLALSGLALGGVYLGGGIARNTAEVLKDSIFMKEFSDKGRMHGLLTNVPVRVILSDDVGLLGAARFASLSEREKRERKVA